MGSDAQSKLGQTPPAAPALSPFAPAPQPAQSLWSSQPAPWQAAEPVPTPATAPAFSPGGIARNLGHLALDVVPYWFGGTVRGEEGTNFAQHALGPENYKQLGDKWDGAKSWAGDKWHGAKSWTGDKWDGAKGWAGGKTKAPEAQHDR